MTDKTPQTTVIQLFRKWRSGDESSGQEMAQRFSDWYYAISTIRVAGQDGRAPMEQACQSFAQGIVSVTRPRALVDWAHDLLERELDQAGHGLAVTDTTGSDHPNAMTRNRSPTDLIHNVAGQLDAEHRRVLALAYDTSQPIETVDRCADALGGTPFAILQARYQLKRALRDTQDVPFAVVPEEADMDRVPISLYEAQRLASVTEIADLEKWLLSDIDLCKDIAEFSAFVHALRGGALKQWAEAPDALVTPAPEQPIVSTEPAESVDSEPASAPEAPPEEPVSTEDDAPVPEPSIFEDNGPELVSEAATSSPSQAKDLPASPPKGSTLKGILITGATITCAIILLLMIMIYALRAG